MFSYFPKGETPSGIIDEDIQLIMERLNNRPRKYLGYRTPHEVFWLIARGALAI